MSEPAECEKCAKLQGLLRELHAKLSEKCNVFFEQDGKPIDILTDLGEAYQESALCEKVSTCLDRRAYGVICPTCGNQIYDDEPTDHTDDGLAHTDCTP